jgi:hypothetical protein
MQKRIITWACDGGERGYTRAFIFGNYKHSAADYMKLVDEAVKDFPHLKLTDIVIGEVTASTYMQGFSLVSFLLPKGTAHESYEPWDRFDFSY